MSEKFTVTWECEDGYAGPSRPQAMELHSYDCGAYMSDEELEEHLLSLVEEDFRQTVSFHIANMNEVMAWMKARRDEATAEEEAGN